MFKDGVLECIISIRVLTNIHVQMCVCGGLNICACALARVVIGCVGQIHKTIKISKRSEGWKEREGSNSYSLQSIELLEKPSRGKPLSSRHPRKTHTETHGHTHTRGKPPLKQRKWHFQIKAVLSRCVCERGEELPDSVAWHDGPFIHSMFTECVCVFD